MRRAAGGLLLVAALLASTAPAQEPPRLLRIAAATIAELREWDARVDALVRGGELRVRQEEADPLVAGRRHERADQVYRGVRVHGGDVTRQTSGGQTVSLFGTLYTGIDVDPRPRIGPDEARAVAARAAGAASGPGRPPELVVLPLDGEARPAYALAWRVRVMTPRALDVFFVDAHTGVVLRRESDLETQAAIGRGRGVLGDDKKVSASSAGGRFVTVDRLRPSAIVTYDLRGDLARTIAFLDGAVDLDDTADAAADADNEWIDAAAVDAHVHAGWTYDYLFKRFGRSGLDNRNGRIRSVVHPVRRQDIFAYDDEIVGIFFLNAFYAGGGILVFGEGLPAGFRLSGGQTVDYFAGALDIVAHELAHGVTEYTSRLVYRGEPGALNEAFSDIVAIGAEFFFQAPGTGPRQADYLVGEDVFRPGGVRSAADPQAYGDPDHYARRFTGPEDNGGVHINSAIVSHAFYLAIEGGRNRTSGLAVTGVGPANREQVERVFFRAFTQMLPSNASFLTARVATIQSARDLYGAGSAVETAVAQAWTAVGVP
jgi:thermolysin